MSEPELSIVIVSFNTCDILRECLDAVSRFVLGTGFEIIVVDNASHDGSPAMVREAFPSVRLIELNENVGFGMGNNAGVEAARGDYLFLLNSDAILMEDIPRALMEYLKSHGDVACVGPRIVWRDGKTQPKAFGYLPSPWRLLMQSLGMAVIGLRGCEGVDGVRRAGPEMDVGWLSGVCLCLRRADYLDAGGFDPRFFMYAEDVALCAKLHRLKGRIVLLDRHDVLHYGGASSPSLPARARNAVWQQRHILQVCEDEFGRGARMRSTAFVAMGLVLRLALAALLMLRRGVRENAGLHVNWARLRDLLGWRTIPAHPRAAGNGGRHAHRH